MGGQLLGQIQPDRRLTSGESKDGLPGSGPKVAVLCRAVNKKWLILEGRVQERTVEGPRERPGKASTNESRVGARAS